MWIQESIPSTSIAFIQASLLTSRDTPNITKSSLLYDFIKLVKPGFSTRQGSHQEAQKSIRIYLDLIWLRDIISPSIPGPENLGANEPMFGDSMLLSL